MSLALTEEQIARRLRAAFDPRRPLRTDGYIAFALSLSDEPLQCAAVLMPLLWREGEWHLLYTRRTDRVENHKGQVSFPGGACDEGETAPEQTALREAREEIGLRPEDVRILGRLNDVVTITRYRVTPVVGRIPWPYPFRLAPLEVKRIFTIPLSWLARRESWEEITPVVDGRPRGGVVIRYHSYDGEVLWGASARMTQNFLRVIGLLGE